MIAVINIVGYLTKAPGKADLKQNVAKEMSSITTVMTALTQANKKNIKCLCEYRI